MRILITGAKGFIGQNLIAGLKNNHYSEIYEYDRDTSTDLLAEYCAKCDFVFNLAGINRPEDPTEFMDGNCDFAALLLNNLKKNDNKCPIMNASSIQASLDNPYGRSKKAGEDLLYTYGKETGSSIYNYRFPNVFGKWCRPNYNSVVATFCYNMANGLPINVHDENTRLDLVYIDDVVSELIRTLQGMTVVAEDGMCYVPITHSVTLGRIVELLQSYVNSRSNLFIPILTENSFEKKLYSTYLSYLPNKDFAYPLLRHEDERGSFTEILKSAEQGQFSVNITKPGVEKGNHWHNTKVEKFVVVQGKALVRFRKYNTNEVIEYHLRGENAQVIDIPPGYTHSILNEGDNELITFMWSNECYDPNKADTFYEPVQ